MRPLWGFPKVKAVLMEVSIIIFSECIIITIYVWYGQKDKNSSTNLFAVPVGIKQKDIVNEMVKKV